MSYGYSTRIVALNKQASRKLLGVQLGRVCIAQGVSVADVASRLVVSRQTVYHWFTGATNPCHELVPSIEKLIASLSR